MNHSLAVAVSRLHPVHHIPMVMGVERTREQRALFLNTVIHRRSVKVSPEPSPERGQGRGCQSGEHTEKGLVDRRGPRNERTAARPGHSREVSL